MISGLKDQDVHDQGLNDRVVKNPALKNREEKQRTLASLTTHMTAAESEEFALLTGSTLFTASTPRDVESLRVDRSEMLRYLGYSGQTLDQGLQARIGEAARLCEEASEPKFLWRAFSVRGACDAEGNPVLRLEGSTLELPGDAILAHLKGAFECVVMACTLGLSNEREARKLSATDPAKAALFSAAGSALVETVADACCENILAKAQLRGFVTGARFSPGYGDLPLGVQPKIVAVLAADKRLGMLPAKGGFVIPAKSVTALVGLFEAKRDADSNTCEVCMARDRCVSRQNPCALKRDCCVPR